MDILTEIKAAKMAELAAAAQSFVNTVVEMDVVPQFEKDTWERQEAEAKAWAADHNAATPMMDMIAALGGDDREALIRGALKKSQLYAPLTAAVIGQRRAYAKQINAAQTIDELDAIQFVFTPPEAV